jgi:phospholipid/cholesterol/gamma-HCH transport system substrate-binding protein
MSRRVELIVGAFLLFGLFCLGYISVETGEIPLLRARTYKVVAKFDSVTGLVKGASVEIAGVPVGRVSSIALVDYRANVELDIDPKVQLQDDAIASVRTKGIIGETYVSILPGGSKKIVPPGGVLRQTEDAVDMQQLISTYIHGKI